jgi:hypothetical protein
MYAFLGDVHLGTKLKIGDYMDSLELFLQKIRDNKEPCKAIFSVGDLFDHRLTIEEARFASLFLLRLVCNFCGKGDRQHVPVYFIHGTYSHDYEQYEIFMPLLRELGGTFVFYTAETCIKTLVTGEKVLLLPQIYGDFDYTPYLSQEYDIIIGHGPISSARKSPCRTGGQEILHSAEALGKISKICVFGHYHGYTDFGNNVFYCGPWLRWQYNEDEPRCFFFCNDKFEVVSEPNPIAMEFKTVSIDTPEQLREALATDIQTPHRFVIKPNVEELEEYHAIMTINKKNKNLSFQMQQIEQPEIVAPETKLPADDTLGPVESLISYIKDKYQIDVKAEIDEYIDKINKE